MCNYQKPYIWKHFNRNLHPPLRHAEWKSPERARLKPGVAFPNKLDIFTVLLQSSPNSNKIP